MFEWDEEKRQETIEARGVDFLYAAQIFEGETVRIVDDRQDYGETRYLAVGTVTGEFFAVVYTLRGDNIRLISARKARKKEYERYQNRIFRRH
jgi:uncharacterized DUF497 family protein